jgi:hypothetical protein
MGGPAQHPGGDLSVLSLPDLSWRDGDHLAQLNALYAWATRLAGNAIDWYYTEKRTKARWSRGLRTLTAILVTLGGLVPIAALAVGRPVLGNWGFVLLGLAAGCTAYDRYFGYSSSWLRYMVAAVKLRGLFADFQLAWATELAALGDRTPTAEDVQRLVERVRSFAWGVNDTIRTETESWMTEFHTRLAELEASVGPPRAPAGSPVARAS